MLRLLRASGGVLPLELAASSMLARAWYLLLPLLESFLASSYASSRIFTICRWPLMQASQFFGDRIPKSQCRAASRTEAPAHVKAW